MQLPRAVAMAATILDNMEEILSQMLRHSDPSEKLF